MALNLWNETHTYTKFKSLPKEENSYPSAIRQVAYFKFSSTEMITVLSWYCAHYRGQRIMAEQVSDDAESLSLVFMALLYQLGTPRERQREFRKSLV